MNAVLERHIGKDAYEAVLDKLNGNEEYREVATDYIEDFLIQLDEQSMLNEGASSDELLEMPLSFIHGYKQSREYGLYYLNLKLKTSFNYY